MGGRGRAWGPTRLGTPCAAYRLHRLAAELSVERPVPVDQHAAETAILVADKMTRPTLREPAVAPAMERPRGGALLSLLWERMQALSGYACLPTQSA
jgi:hypothetical protein